jgi:hypothetical protein
MSDRDGLRERIQARIAARKQITEDVVTALDPSDIAGLYLVTEAECPGCHEAMEEFMDDIVDGTLKVVDIGDEKGFAIVQALGVDRVPKMVVELKDGRYLEWKGI